MTILKTLFMLAFIPSFFTQPLLAFPRNDLKPGGVAVLAVAPSNKPKPRVTYQKIPVAIVKATKTG